MEIKLKWIFKEYKPDENKTKNKVQKYMFLKENDCIKVSFVESILLILS